MKQIDVTDFIEENLKTIFAYALSRVSRKEDAEDLTNDIVVAILQSADNIKNPDAFYGYVWGIAANTYRKFMRKRQHFASEALDDNTSDGADFTADFSVREDISALRREIALLSKEYRECTIAYYYDELSCTEIAKKSDISLEMVKYYLFKTRKILKEGISMEREFGEKSFRPAPFEFLTIFSGSFNLEYRNLFARKLPGQILLSAYYTPMTVRELAIELGVASVYLEDELGMLESYNLITKTPAGKYQTNLIIFTDDFTNEFHKKAKPFAICALTNILTGVQAKLERIRTLNSTCSSLSDNRLLWSLLFPLMLRGNTRFEEKYPDFDKRDTLYASATGTNYGISSSLNDSMDSRFTCNFFAGYSKIDETHYAVAADFGVLPKHNHYFTDSVTSTIIEAIRRTEAAEIKPEFMILTESEEQTLFALLSDEIEQMASLYNSLFACASQLMRIHAPKNVASQVDRIICQTLFFRTVGLIGGCAVKSNILQLPDFNGPAAMYIRKTVHTESPCVASAKL